MPLPQAVARFNKRYTNWLIEPLVGRLPGFVTVRHIGRRSGAQYRTPLYAFASDTHLFIALTYGPDADWVQNVLHGGGILERPRDEHVAMLDLDSDQWAVVPAQAARPHLPQLVRGGLRLVQVSHFMQIAQR